MDSVRVPQRSGTASTPSGAADNVGLVFEVNGKSRDLVIKVVDRESKRILREIPPAEVRRVRSTMQDILGVMFDRQG
jgi:uncharacterized FlaG/YvyC family protein